MPAEEVRLTTPLRVGRVYLKNRLGLGPINPGFFNNDGSARQPVVDFYRDYSAAGLSLVYVGGVAISEGGRSNAQTLVLARPAHISGLAVIAEVAHGHGCRLAVQLMHSGRQASAREVGARRIAASPLRCPVTLEVPYRASLADIRTFVREFATSARLARRSGADLLEIHAAHGYLLSGFLSRSSNQRRDAYGGSITNRYRLLRQILAEVAGLDFDAVGVRVNVAETNQDRLGLLAETVEGLAECVGLVDFVSVSAGVYTNDHDLVIPKRQLGDALWADHARQIKETLRTSVFLAGNIRTAEAADLLVGSGAADLVLMVRSLLADPYLLTKWAEGRSDSIQPCDELYQCKYHLRGLSHVYCPHNRILHEALHPRRAGARLGPI